MKIKAMLSLMALFLGISLAPTSCLAQTICPWPPCGSCKALYYCGSTAGTDQCGCPCTAPAGTCPSPNGPAYRTFCNPKTLACDCPSNSPCFLPWYECGSTEGVNACGEACNTAPEGTCPSPNGPAYRTFCNPKTLACDCPSNSPCVPNYQCGSTEGTNACGEACNSAPVGTCPPSSVIAPYRTFCNANNWCDCPSNSPCVPNYQCGSTAGTNACGEACNSAPVGTCPPSPSNNPGLAYETFCNARHLCDCPSDSPCFLRYQCGSTAGVNACSEDCTVVAGTCPSGEYCNPSNRCDSCPGGRPCTATTALAHPDKMTLTRDPVNIATGEAYFSSTDFSLSEPGPKLSLFRKYRSLSTFKGMFGYGWRTDFDLNLSQNGQGDVTIFDGEGTEIYFMNNSGAYAPSPGNSSTLTKNADNTFTLTDKNGKLSHYDLNGRLTSVTDRHGHTLTFVYNSAMIGGAYIQDSTGRQIKLYFDTNGHIISAQDPAGKTYSYGYDVNGNLSHIIDPSGAVTNYDYDSNHKIIKFTNANGHKTYYAYDALARAYQNWQDGNVNKVTLNFQSNNTTIVTDSLNHPTTYVFNNMGLETSRTDALGHTKTTVWDSNMNKLSETDENGNQTGFSYDDKSNLVKKVNALGESTTYTYEPNFNLIQSITDIAGKTTNNTYDSNGNLLTVKDKLGHRTQMTYDAAGNRLSIEDALHNTTAMQYNSLNQFIKKTNALGKSTLLTYDVPGNLTSVTDPKGHRTQLTYDALNRLIKKTFADGTTESYQYDAFGNNTKVTDQKGHLTVKAYDAYERLAQTTDPNGGTISFAYDTEGHLTGLTDPKNQTTTFTYDALGHLLTKKTPLGNPTAYSYDQVGNILNKTDADGKTITYAYDGLNRLTKVLYPNNSQISYTYDDLHYKTSGTDVHGTITDTYDGLGHLIAENGPDHLKTIEYQYDAFGHRIYMADQDRFVTTYTYDALNRLKTIKDSTGSVTSYAYDDNSNLTTTSYGNRTKAVRTYDSLNRIVREVNYTSKNTIISSTINQYDPSGMVVKKTLKDNSSIQYIYDNKNQLIRETRQYPCSPWKYPGPQTSIVSDYLYKYDAAGNRILFQSNLTKNQFYSQQWPFLPRQTRDQMTADGLSPSNHRYNVSYALQKTLRYDADNRLISFSQDVSAGGWLFPVREVTYRYNNNGNRIAKSVLMAGAAVPQDTSYTYDLENRLVRLNFSTYPILLKAKSADFDYDSFGRRIRATEGRHHETLFSYDGNNVILANDMEALTEDSYTRGLDYGGGIGGIISQTKNMQTQYFHYDPQGSVTNLSSQSGAVNTTYDYDAYGQTTPSWQPGQNPYRFSTKEWLGYANLYYFGARYYDPEVGRWLTPDPLGFVNGPNTYLYCLNNPVNFVDPYGLMLERLIYGNNFNPQGAINEFGLGDISNEPPVTSFIWDDPIFFALFAIDYAEIEIAPQGNNIFRIMSKKFKWGYRIDKADFHKPYIHDHRWRW